MRLVLLGAGALFFVLALAGGALLLAPRQTRVGPQPFPAPPRAGRPSFPEVRGRPEAGEAVVSPPEGPSVLPDTREFVGTEPSVVLSEVHYHPSSNDRRDEWIEILNRGKKAVDLGGWKLAGAVSFTFPPGTSLGAGEHLLACADAARVRETLGVERAIGDWTGGLGDGGERIVLQDAQGNEVEAFAYSDRGAFPVLPDGGGPSLERRSPHERADLPSNWGASLGAAGSAGTWKRYAAKGTVTANRLYFYLSRPGVAYVDDVKLRSGDGEEDTEDFEGATSRWSFNGNHSGSRIGPGQARSGERSLKVVAAGAGTGRTSATAWSLPAASNGSPCEVEFWALVPDPEVAVVARLSSGGTGTPGLALETEARGGGGKFTPGRVNSIHGTDLPLVVTAVAHAPERPRPQDRVVVRATLPAAPGSRQVLLHWTRQTSEAPGEAEEVMPLRDDGLAKHGDAAAGDGVHSASIGPFPAGTVVLFRVTAEGPNGRRGAYPLEENPTRRAGFFVEGPGPAADFPVYQLFLSRETIDDLERNSSSDAYRRGLFVHDGRVYPDIGVRYRGHTSRWIPKHHWKVKFNKDNPLKLPWSEREVGSININSSYGDKLFLREILAFNLWRDLGEAYCESWHVVLRLNGAHQGFYVHVENPGGDYLRRNGLEEGWLWKSYTNGLNGAYGFELEEGEPQSGGQLLGEFLRSVSTLSGPELDAYIRDHMLVDSFINFLAACQLIHSADHVEKNYLVYADPGGRFTYFPWDMDLTHGRNFECNGGGIWNDQIRHDLWDREYRDEKLLFATAVHGKCDGHANAVIDAVLRKATAFRSLYYERLAAHLAHYYHPSVIIPKAERLRDRIRAEVIRDRGQWGTYGGNDDFDVHFKAFTGWVRRRFEHLSRKLDALGHEVGPPLNADLEASVQSGPAPLAVSFRDLSAGRIERHEWDFGDGASSVEGEPTHVFEKPGSYDVALKVTGPDGTHACVRKKQIRVRPPRPE